MKASTNDIFYHGTIEEFDYQNPDVGADGVFWTAKNKKIATTYIPVSGSKISMNTSHILSPSQNPEIIELQNKIGFNYYDVEWDNRGIKSYRIRGKQFEQFKKQEQQYYQKLVDIDKKEKEIKVLHNNDKDDMEIIDKWIAIVDEKKEIEQEWKKNDANDKMKQVINGYLEKIGYKGSGNWEDKSYVLKSHNNHIMPASYKAAGTLLQVVPKKELNMLDMRKSDEGDLTDPDHQRYDDFSKAEQKGYDGVIINDFAQSETHGNFGHTSYGFFQKTLPFLTITVIDTKATHPDSLYERIMISESILTQMRK